MAGWQKWAIIIGGLLAVIGQWWGMDFYLPLIGGVLALLGALIKG
tara:strand:+ start:186 stop:320 length:135 start_codon:yes stop_codon:yes gene_type:complete